MTDQQTPVPIHQWTHEGEHVLLLKCVPNDMTTHDGFVWPKSGPVNPEKWSREATCESGGLFGWPWGKGIGDGKDPDATATWLVFAAQPENVIAIGDKAKAVPGEDGSPAAEVVYCGNMAGAIALTTPGWMAWVFSNASGQAAASGESGQAAASGERGQAASSGARGQAAASGWRGQAAASGARGQAAASGERGQAAASGWSGQAAASGERGQAAASGWSGQAAASGLGGMAISDCQAMAGEQGMFAIRWHDGTSFRFAVGIVGENGIKPNVWYEVRDGVLAEVAA